MALPRISNAEYEKRLNSFKELMAKHNLDLVVGFSNILDPSTVRYFSDFSAVNESIWEHMKLLFFPAASYALITYPFMRKSSPPYLTACAFAILIGMAVQTSIYYIYSGIIGKDIPWVNIAIFYGCAALIYVLSYKWNRRKWNTGSLWGLAVISAMSVLFFWFTANPPDLGIFSEPDGFSLTQFSSGTI
jgi:hypothetical protein